ncbi:MAG TPA: rRNA maturation RNase YbeY [Candidatus Acidoferrum sp.]|nr:rRNA maturation RNase YbeY [Candidatus Acidoferrum sp.]
MILNRQRTVRVARPPLEAFLARVREQLRLTGAEITVCLVSDPVIARMNETFRHKKGPTDVLSFPTDEPRQDFVGAQDSCAPSRQHRSASRPRRLKRFAAAPDAHSLGDIAISPATARRNARKLGRTLPGELQILILHGVLHLLGYDHETDNGQMTRVENRLRRKLGLQ